MLGSTIRKPLKHLCVIPYTMYPPPNIENRRSLTNLRVRLEKRVTWNKYKALWCSHLTEVDETCLRKVHLYLSHLTLITSLPRSRLNKQTNTLASYHISALTAGSLQNHPNRALWTTNWLKCFDVCFCLLFWGSTLYKTWQNTEVVMCAHATNQ